jgi:lysophospholipase L1-like esterase
MADYQEYRRRILHRRWRRMFITAALLILLVLLAAVGVLWKRLHREPAPNTAQGPTILQQELTGSEWNTISYTPARRLSVQTLDNGMTAMDFRLAAQPASPAVERSSFSDVSFLGDSLTQGMQLYDTGLPNAHFCAYKGVGPNAVVNNTTCRRADGEKEIPMEALASQQPRALYILLGTNVLTTDSDYTSFLTYYRLMLDMISQALPNTKIYVQSITPVRPEVSKKSPGLQGAAPRHLASQHRRRPDGPGHTRHRLQCRRSRQRRRGTQCAGRDAARGDRGSRTSCRCRD